MDNMVLCVIMSFLCTEQMASVEDGVCSQQILQVIYAEKTFQVQNWIFPLKAHTSCHVNTPCRLIHQCASVKSRYSSESCWANIVKMHEFVGKQRASHFLS